MPATFPIRDVLTEREFDYLINLNNSRFDHGRVDEHLAGVASPDLEHSRQEYLQKCHEVETATLILTKVFTGTNRRNYFGDVSNNRKAFHTLAEDFNQWSMGKGPHGPTRSGMMPLLARIMTKQIEYDHRVIDQKNSYLLVPGIFTNSELIDELDPQGPSWLPKDPIKTQEDSNSLKALSRAAFGVDMQTEDKVRASDNISSTVLASAIDTAAAFRHPTLDREFAIHFAETAGRLVLHALNHEMVQHAITRGQTNLDRIASEIRKPRALLRKLVRPSQEP